jgi:hypothetical protein
MFHVVVRCFALWGCDGVAVMFHCMACDQGGAMHTNNQCGQLDVDKLLCTASRVKGFCCCLGT